MQYRCVSNTFETKHDQHIFFLLLLEASVSYSLSDFLFLLCFFLYLSTNFFSFFSLFLFSYEGSSKGFGIRNKGIMPLPDVAAFPVTLWANISWVQKGKVFFQGVPGQRTPWDFSFLCICVFCTSLL